MRKQRAFATLTEAEIEQIAEWLRLQTYDEVRERIARPRPEGFALKISINPLQNLRAKRETVDKINQRIKEATPLSLADFDAIKAGERPDLCEEVHNAIMGATYDLAVSGENTPSDLLNLQRLADFDARADLRARKEQREVELHAHKLQMDLHRQEMAEKRFALSERALDLREQLALKRSSADSSLTTRNSPTEDALGPLATTLDDIERRAIAKFGRTNPPVADAECALCEPICNPLAEPKPEADSVETTVTPPNLLETHAAVTLVTASSALPASPNAQSPGLVIPASRENPSIITSESRENSSENAPQPAESSSVADNVTGKTSSPEVTTKDFNPVPAHHIGFPAPVIAHAIKRWRAHIPRPKDTPEPDGSWRQECPCGHPLPCPEHGEMPLRAKCYKPQHPDYKFHLDQVGVPHYIPTAEEIGCTQAALDRSRDLFADNPRLVHAPAPRFPSTTTCALPG